MFTEELLREYLVDFAGHDASLLRSRWYATDIEFETLTVGSVVGVDALLNMFGDQMHVGLIEHYDASFAVVSPDGERGGAMLDGHRFYTQDRPDHGTKAGDRVHFALLALYRFTGDKISWIATARLRFDINPDRWTAPAALQSRIDALDGA